MSWMEKLSPAAKAILAENPAMREALERKPPPWAKAEPKVRAIAVPVSDAVAEAAKTNPESVRVAARDAQGRHLVSGPEQKMMPDGMTSAVGWIGWGGRGQLSDRGLWFEPDQGGGAVSAYNPIARFEEEIE
jgi:phenylpyruvate tautomerase PptA (4-oxalocrotonate tautomerase family)